MKNGVIAIRIFSAILIMLITLIFIESIMAVFDPPKAIWNHIRENLLVEYSLNTILLVTLSMVISGVIGSMTAYFVTRFEFFQRKTLSALLYFPLAIPPYIGAYVYAESISKNGIIADLIGRTISIPQFLLAVITFSLFLFPYVYIGVKGYITHNMGGYVENALLLEKGEGEIFFKVILPITKPAIITGTILVGLEVLGDFGVVQYFGIPTFSTAIYKSWIGFKDFDSALRLGGILMIGVFILLLIKGHVVNKKYHYSTTTKVKELKRKKLSFIGQIIMFLFIFTILSFSLIFPIYQLIVWATMSFDRVRYINLIMMLRNTILITTFVTLIIVFFAIILSSYLRVSSRILKVIFGKLTLISYALPGSLLAMMILLFFMKVDNFFQISLSTTILMLITAYVIRFLGTAYENMENGFQKVGKKYHEASRTLGKSYYTTLVKVDLPILKPFILSAFSLVFIDLLKELPLTLILRPFNFHTLATQVYQYASDEMLPESAVPSLFIIIISIFFITGIIKKEWSR